MPDPDEQSTPMPGGSPARRLREFLDQRLPVGGKPEDLNPELAEQQKEQPGPDEE